MEIIKKMTKRELICGLARQNCIAMLQTRALLDAKTVADICGLVSRLCGEYDDEACTQQSKLCREAGEAIARGDEIKYLELCNHACTTCPYVLRQEPNKETLQ